MKGDTKNKKGVTSLLNKQVYIRSVFIYILRVRVRAYINIH